MVDQKIYYQLYKEETTIRINELLNKELIYLQNRKNIKNKLVIYKNIINRKSNISFSKILKTTDSKLVNSIEFKNVDKTTVKLILMYIDYYISSNRAIYKIEKEVDKLRDKEISFSLYYSIICKFNKKVLDYIIKDRFVLELGHYLGVIRMVKHTSKKPIVDWGASNKKKQELLDKGEIPYKKKDEEEALKRGEEYKGIKYLQYHNPKQLWIEWDYNPRTINLMPIIRDFTFKIAGGNYSAKKMVTKFKETVTNEEIDKYPNRLEPYYGKNK